MKRKKKKMNEDKAACVIIGFKYSGKHQIKGILLDLFRVYKFAKKASMDVIIITDIETDNQEDVNRGFSSNYKQKNFHLITTEKYGCDPRIYSFIEDIKETKEYHQYTSRDALQNLVLQHCQNRNRIFFYYTGHAKIDHFLFPTVNNEFHSTSPATSYFISTNSDKFFLRKNLQHKATPPNYKAIFPNHKAEISPNHKAEISPNHKAIFPNHKAEISLNQNKAETKIPLNAELSPNYKAEITPNHKTAELEEVKTNQFLNEILLFTHNPNSEMFFMLDCCNTSNMNLPYVLNMDFSASKFRSTYYEPGGIYRLCNTQPQFYTQNIICICSAMNDEVSTSSPTGSTFTELFFQNLELNPKERNLHNIMKEVQQIMRNKQTCRAYASNPSITYLFPWLFHPNFIKFSYSDTGVYLRLK